MSLLCHLRRDKLCVFVQLIKWTYVRDGDKENLEWEYLLVCRKLSQ